MTQLDDSKVILRTSTLGITERSVQSMRHSLCGKRILINKITHIR